MCVATMKSMTYALKGKNILETKGIPAEIISLDPSLTSHGCAYGISFACGQSGDVKRLLDMKKIAYGEIIGDLAR